MFWRLVLAFLLALAFIALAEYIWSDMTFINLTQGDL